ncbi:DUF4083 domain-containing protein [Bacillus mangrovi]|uniref:DUF4083 domain-containing protein n=1 Tax=Metabacillus mangrovi TaxID=1491830 RepID=A0A7X2S661_9BACI|nr:DUF4083 domain-containing protein [Metabacillus mangrovi]MTH54347.1 DUF4083 domain-containing protein [Metabacillus mangrovi]
MGYNAGDVLFQLFSFSLLFFAGAVIVRFFRSSSRSKQQLGRIEKKLDRLMEERNSRF